MILLVEGIYILAMLCGIIWLIRRLVRFVRVSVARREGEALWAESFSEGEFQTLLETLRQKRDNQGNQANSLDKYSQPNGPPSEPV
jgi:hypothetical protein